MERIIEVVCNQLEISRLQLFSKSRKGNVVKARFLCWFFIKKNLDWSATRIASEFKLTHGSILHGISNIEFQYEVDEDDRELVKKIWLKLRYNLDDKGLFNQSVYRELIEVTIKYDYRAFCKLAIDTKTRYWIYEDLKIDKETIKKIEIYYGKPKKGKEDKR